MKETDKHTWQNRIIAVLIVLALGLAFLALESRSKRDSDKAIAEIESIQDAQCAAGNATRLGLFASAGADREMYLQLEGQEHDPEVARIWHRAATRKQDVQDSILGAARQRGALVDPHQPVVDCNP